MVGFGARLARLARRAVREAAVARQTVVAVGRRVQVRIAGAVQLIAVVRALAERLAINCGGRRAEKHARALEEVDSATILEKSNEVASANNRFQTALTSSRSWSAAARIRATRAARTKFALAAVAIVIQATHTAVVRGVTETQVCRLSVTADKNFQNKKKCTAAIAYPVWHWQAPKTNSPWPEQAVSAMPNVGLSSRVTAVCLESYRESALSARLSE